jgi:hypothetical protein
MDRVQPVAKSMLKKLEAFICRRRNCGQEGSADAIADAYLQMRKKLSSSCLSPDAEEACEGEEDEEPAETLQDEEEACECEEDEKAAATLQDEEEACELKHCGVHPSASLISDHLKDDSQQLVGFGKYVWHTFGEIAEKQPRYCQEVVMKNKEPKEEMRRLQEYLETHPAYSSAEKKPKSNKWNEFEHNYGGHNMKKTEFPLLYRWHERSALEEQKYSKEEIVEKFNAYLAHRMSRVAKTADAKQPGEAGF